MGPPAETVALEETGAEEGLPVDGEPEVGGFVVVPAFPPVAATHM